MGGVFKELINQSERRAKSGLRSGLAFKAQHGIALKQGYVTYK
jgi:hypothetical protein